MSTIDNATLASSWSFPTKVLFGAGKASETANACREAGISKPLLVTDAGLADAPFMDRISDALKKEGLDNALFSDVRSNPNKANLTAGIEAFRAGDHDGVIAIGGGSGLDCGKLIAFMAGQTRSVWDFEDIGDYWKRADSDGISPIVALPTTAGTGSEVGRAGVLTDERVPCKKVIFHPKILPHTAILDPELTVGLPAKLTAATGMDALAHCIEAYCAPGFHPMAEGIAVEGIRLCLTALPRAFDDGSDITARGAMLSASAMGAVAFQKGLGGVHALSHPIGAVYDTHHGLTNAVFLPYVLNFNRPAIAERMDRLSGWLGLAQPGLDGFIAEMIRLRNYLGIAHTIAELGVPDDRFDELAAMAVVDPTAGGNPIELTEDICKRLFEDAHQGRLELPG